VNNISEMVINWKWLSTQELDQNISDFIKDSGLSFFAAYNEIVHKTYLNDSDLFKKLCDSFFRLSASYIDDNTKDIINRFKSMADKDVEQFFIETYRNHGKDEVYRIYIFISDNELRNRMDRILSVASAKFRKVDLLKKLENWSSMDDDSLRTQIEIELIGSGWTSSASHFAFVRELYINITDDTLRNRVDNILLAMTEPEYLASGAMDACGRALYVCVNLKLPNYKAHFIKLINSIDDPNDLSVRHIVNWINIILKDCPVSEAEEYLVKQMDVVPLNIVELLSNPTKLDYQERNRLTESLVTHSVLKLVNSQLADKFSKILKLQ